MTNIISGRMVFPWGSITRYDVVKDTPVLSAVDTKVPSRPGWLSTTITRLRKSAVYSALTVIVVLSAGTVILSYLHLLPDTYVKALGSLFQ